MSKLPTTGSAHETPPRKSAAVLLLGDIADTTWRMFVPTLGALLLGRWADTQLGTGPWGVLIGAIVGFAVAIWLVTKQVKRVS